MWPATWKSCASSTQARADMQKPVGLCFVHQGSTFWHVVQNRARHDNSKVQRFDSNGSYEFSNALSSYPGCSKIKKYFLLFPHEGCANPQPKEPFFPLHVFGCVQCNLWSRFFCFFKWFWGIDHRTQMEKVFGNGSICWYQFQQEVLHCTLSRSSQIQSPAARWTLPCASSETVAFRFSLI